MTPSMGLGYLGFQEGNYTQDTTFKHGWMQVAFLMMLQKSLGLSLRPVFGVLCWLRSLRISLMDQNCKLYPPCIAHYKVDILCAYKVGFRSPLYIPTMGDKAVFCARNMPLDLEDEGVHEMTAMSWKLGEGSTERSFTKVYIVEVPLSLFPECKPTTLFSNSKI